MKWETLQSEVKGLNLNDLVKENFLKKLNEEFENKDIDIITLQVAVRDKVFESETEANLDVMFRKISV